MSSPITTHILDLSTGLPAGGVAVTLSHEGIDGWAFVSERVTDADGRVRDLLDATAFGRGRWRLRFAVEPYFAMRGVACFFPYVELVFDVTDLTRHHHVPLLLSPYGYSTYRGS